MASWRGTNQFGGEELSLEPEKQGQGWSNQLLSLETELEEKIKKEKQMCNHINDLKEDLEKKLRELDENQNSSKDTPQSYSQKLFPSRKIAQVGMKHTNQLRFPQSPQQKQISEQRNYLQSIPSVSSPSSKAIALDRPLLTSGMKTNSFKVNNEVTQDEKKQILSNLEQERQLKYSKAANEQYEKEIQIIKQSLSLEQERRESFQKENIQLSQRLKRLESENYAFQDKIKDLEWENERLIEEANIKENKVRQIRDNDEKVLEYQQKLEEKIKEIAHLQNQIDQINDKHLQFKRQVQEREEQIKSEIHTSELIIEQQEHTIERQKETIQDLEEENTALSRERQVTVEIEEDWKQEISARIQREREIEELEVNIKNKEEDHQIKEVQLQGRILLLFAENERLHQVIMNMQLDLKTLKGQIALYQQNTLNISFNKDQKSPGQANLQEEIDKLRLHLQLKLKEIESLKNKLESLENCPQIITELERKLKLQIAENKRINQLMYSRINEKW